MLDGLDAGVVSELREPDIKTLWTSIWSIVFLDNNTIHVHIYIIVILLLYYFFTL
jgi:hypothetical protein